MQVQTIQTEARIESGLSLADEVRSALEALLVGDRGTMRLCDALVTVAVELALPSAGPGGTAAWLERTAYDVRTGRLSCR